MAMATRTGVKLLMKIATATTTHDDLIDSLLTAADNAVKRWTGRNLEAASGIVEYPVAYGTREIRLRETPVTVSGLTSIYYDTSAYFGRGSGDFAAATLLTEGTDYVLRVDQTNGTTSKCGIIDRINGIWTNKRVRQYGHLAAGPEPRRGHIKVTYDCVGTYGTADDVETAANMIVIRLMNAGKTGSRLQSESYAGYSYNLVQPTPGLINDEIAELLMPYRFLDAGG